MARAGERIGSIRVVRVLGVGGMGEVYEGWDETLQRKVALKTIGAARRFSEQARARFLREARILSQLDHPNICRIHDFLSEADTDCLVLEYIEGRTLDEVLEQPLSFEARLEIALAIAGVLVAAHGEGIVHRDLKPGNVMVTGDHEVKVLDFGLARAGEQGAVGVGTEAEPAAPGPGSSPSGGSRGPGADETTLESEAQTLDSENVDSENEPLDSDSQARTMDGRPAPEAAPETADRSFLLTRAGSVLGTPLYMSPEQARGEPIQTSSDLYSFGLLLHSLFTGERPYPSGIRGDQLISMASRGETRPVTGLGADLTNLIDKLESLAPAARPTAVEAQARLEWIRNAPKRRLRRLAAASAVVAIALAGLKYTVDLSRERTAAVAARQMAEQRRDQAEELIGFMLGDLRDKLEPLGRLEILDDVGANAMAYFAAVSEAQLSDEELSSRSRALYQIADVRIAQGNLDGAVAPLEESLALAQRLVERNPDHGERLFEAGQAQFWLGFVHWRRDDLEAALGPFREYLSISRRLEELDPDNLEWRMELGYAYSNIASILEEQGHLAEALEGFEATLGIKSALASARPDDADWQLDLARSHSTVGKTLERLGQWGNALDHYGAELAIKQKLVAQQPEHARWRLELAISRNYVAMLRLAMGDVQESEQQFRAALEELRRLTTQDATNTEWLREYAATLCFGSDALVRTGARSEAKSWLEEAIALQEQLVATDRLVIEFQRDRVASLARLGRLLLLEREIAGAEAAGRTAARLLEQLTAGKTEDRRLRLLEAEVQTLLGDVGAALGEGAQARQAWSRAVDAVAELAAGSDDRRVLEPWLRALLALGWAERARPVLERLASFGYRNAEVQRKLQELIERIGDEGC